MQPDGCKPRQVILDCTGRKLLLPLEKDVDDQGIWRLHCSFTSKLAEQLHPLQLIESLQHLVVPEELVSLQPRVSIAWSYEPQIAQIFCNAKPALQDFDIHLVSQRLQNGTCTCAHLHEQYRSPTACCTWPDGSSSAPHVCTLDPTILQHQELIYLAKKGLNHIPLPPIDPEPWLEQLIITGSSYMDRLRTHFGTSLIPLPSSLEDYITGWFQRRYSRLTRSQPLHLQHATQGFSELPSPPALATLQQLQTSLYISEVDKAAHQPCFTCQDFAIWTLWQRLSSTDFELLPQQDADLLSTALNTLQHQWLPATLEPDRLLLLSTRWTFKAHKNGYRFITNGANYTLTPLDSMVQLMSAALLRELKTWAGHQNHTIFLSKGFHTQFFPIIPDYTACLLNLPQHITSDFTADVSKCFECIPIDSARSDSLQAALRSLGSRVCSSLSRDDKGKPCGFKVVFRHSNNMPCRAEMQRITNPTPLTRCFTLEQYLAMVDLLATNAITAAGGQLFRQKAGIPMGIRSSPDLCNLYLLHKEIEAILRIAKYDPPPLAKEKLTAFRSMFRSMDDVRILNGPALVQILRHPGPRLPTTTDWVYPECLGLEVTSPDSGPLPKTCFLDIVTWYDNGRTLHTTFAKESKLPFTPIQYVDSNSNRPSAACYNIAIGATLHAVMHASSIHLALTRLKYILKIFLRRGFDKDKVKKKCIKTLEELRLPDPPFSIPKLIRLARCKL